MLKSKITAKDIMSANVLKTNVNHSFTHVWRLFFQLNIHHLPVVNEEEQLVGIISTNDILKQLAFNLPVMDKTDEESLNDQFSVQMLMTPHPLKIKEDTPLKEIAQIFSKNHISALPVVDDNEVIRGIVTSRDLIDFYAQERKSSNIGSMIRII
jgi:CBS domain-containing protein